MTFPRFPDAALRNMDAFLKYAVETYEVTEKHIEGRLADRSVSQPERRTLARTLNRARRNLAKYRRCMAEQTRRDLANESD